MGEDGKQIGVIPTSEALAYAQERDLDLVEVAPDARPPVCRVLDYSKYKYEQVQKQKAARKHQQQINIREIKFRPKIAQNDYDTKKGHVRRFLLGKDRVKVTIMFRGREVTHPERGTALLEKLAERAVRDRRRRADAAPGRAQHDDDAGAVQDGSVRRGRGFKAAGGEARPRLSRAAAAGTATAQAPEQRRARRRRCPRRRPDVANGAGTGSPERAAPSPRPATPPPDRPPRRRPRAPICRARIRPGRAPALGLLYCSVAMPKMKTHSGAKKRFKLTATGKVRGRHSFTSHILEKKSPKRKRHLGQPAAIAKVDEKAVKTLLGAKRKAVVRGERS